MATIFLTGFPGFLGAALVERLLARLPAGDEIICLIQEKYREYAETRVAALPGRHTAIRLVGGDITLPDLGLGDSYDALQASTTEVYHLAALYDLGCGRELAMQINVAGTRHMLEFAAGCPQLQRFHHTSTCYVSGRYDGVFTERDLSVSQTFNNHYEETKYLAELAVQQAMAEGMPVTIYRPSIVIGDSETGETQKYDGPYYVMQWLLRQPKVAVAPVIGDAGRYEINTVPRDFVIDAFAYLSGLEEAVGRVYHLSDPNPLTVAEMLDVLQEATGRQVLRVPVPKKLTKKALGLRPVHSVVRVEPEALEYFAHPTRYRCDETQRALAGSGITCPPFIAYVDRLIAFMEQHPEVPASAMV